MESPSSNKCRSAWRTSLTKSLPLAPALTAKTPHHLLQSLMQLMGLRAQGRGGHGTLLADLLDEVRHRLISSIRVRVEHAMGGVKRYRMVKDRLRNWKAGFRDLVFETCCGLHNFRLNFRPWHYKPITYLNYLLKS
jgi:hypothetical protein